MLNEHYICGIYIFAIILEETLTLFGGILGTSWINSIG